METQIHGNIDSTADHGTADSWKRQITEALIHGNVKPPMEPPTLLTFDFKWNLAHLSPRLNGRLLSITTDLDGRICLHTRLDGVVPFCTTNCLSTTFEKTVTQ